MDESVEDISPEELQQQLERQRQQEQEVNQEPSKEFEDFGNYYPYTRRFRMGKYNNNNNMETPFSSYSDVSYGQPSTRSRGGRRGDSSNNRQRSNPNESSNDGRSNGTDRGSQGGTSSSTRSGQGGRQSYGQGGQRSVGRRSRNSSWDNYQSDNVPDYYQYDLIDDPYYNDRNYERQENNSSEYSNNKKKERNMPYIENNPLSYNGGFGGYGGGFAGGFGYPVAVGGGDGGSGLLALGLLAGGRDRGYCPTPFFAGGHGDGNASAAAIAAIALGNRDRDHHHDFHGHHCHDRCDDRDGHGLLASLIAMDKLGDIEGAVALSALGTQKAVSDGTSSVQDSIVQSTIANLRGQADIGMSIANAVSTAKDLNAAQTQVLSGLINNVGNAVDRNLYTLTATVKDDGEKTRALITANQIAELNRIAQERQDEIIELKSEARRRDDRHGIEITMVNNQNQNQLQFQQQAQLLGQIGHLVSSCNQRIDAQNTAINVGGTQVAGQTSTNNNNNVRV